MLKRRAVTKTDPEHERGALIAEMQALLRRHVMDAWFPACIDTENGGFHSTFDRKWRRTGSTDQLLEFQARQTRACANLAIAFPNEGKWQEYALHGLKNLREKMWDREYGGWFRLVSADGTPLEAGTKHGHGSAYAAQAAACVFRATGDHSALEHAEEGIEWFDKYARDSTNGGFHNWYLRDGMAIRTVEQVPKGCDPLDPLGHDVGLKDINVHGDWYEALLALTEVSDSGLARSLLEEFAGIYLAHATTGNGAVHCIFSEDWTPQPGLETYGYGFQAAHRFFTTSRVRPDISGMDERGRAVMLNTVRRARMKRGGFCYAGPATEPTWLEGRDMRVPARAWWVQFEGLRCLALFAASAKQPDRYLRAVRAQFEFIKHHLVDDLHGGTYGRPIDDWGRWVRAGVPRQGWAFRKGGDWKDASHETDSLLAAISALREFDSKPDERLA